MAKPVKVVVLGDASDAKRAFREVNQAAGKTESKLKRVSEKLSSAGRDLTTRVTLPLAAVGGLSIKAASDLEQSQGAVQSVLGDSAGKIQEFGETAAKEFGLSRREVNETGAVIGAQLKNMGFSADEAGGEVVNLQKRAADMAATFGGSTAAALDAVGSLMRGERDPIEKYGVSIKQADINARLAAQGQSELEGEARKQAEAQAALAILMEQTADVQGQFARESDTLAGQQARVRAQAENLGATLGTILLPVGQKLVGWLQKLVEWFQNLSPGMQKTIVTLAGVAAAVGPVLIVAGKAVQAFGAVGKAFGVLTKIVSANPWVIIIAATIALVTLIVANWDKIVAFLKKTWEWIKRTAGQVWDFLKRIFKAGLEAVVNFVLNWTLVGRLIKHWDDIKEGVQAVKDFFVEKWDEITDFFSEIPGRIASTAGGMWDSITSSFKSVINTIIGWWNNLSFTIGGQTIDLPFGQSFTIPSVTLSTPNIPYLHSGGVFRAPPGQSEGLAMLQDREVVLPAGQPAMAGAGPTTINLVVDGKTLARVVRDDLIRLKRRNGTDGLDR